MKTVLIADDEKNIRSTLATTFRLEGYRVETAEDGRRAIEIVERTAVDAIVLDLQMPGLDGYETLRELRRKEHGVPVIFLTAHGTIERAVEAVKLGAFDFIEKPPHSEKILLAVKNALRQADLEEENRELRSEETSRFDMIGASAPMRALYEQIIAKYIDADPRHAWYTQGFDPKKVEALKKYYKDRYDQKVD